MTMQAAETAQTSVRRSITVNVPIERAFRVFTEGMHTWWPPEHHLIEADLAEMVFEPRVGGAIKDVGVDGSECAWATVLAYEPPTRVVFSWNIGLDWKLESDPERASRVEVRFTRQGEHATLVELEHRDFERHGEGWESMRDAVGSPGGWSLEGYAAAAERAA
ncbi:MAG TPA: SRPBCC family protein [Solirubrobacteraceae bacterium]|nr:SRPBCC family protein [Solirubrobacteraceae bacterium]